MSYPAPYPAQPATVSQPASRAVARVLSGLCGLVLTPVAIGVLAYGGYRQQTQVSATFAEHGDGLGMTLMVVGALLLVGVAVLGAWSSTGPIVGGLIWGVLPGVATLVSPRTGIDLLRLLPADELAAGFGGWLVSGALLGTGFLLVGAGLATTLARRRR
ncbi:hypothetical protein [Amycolatopsis circi]|uniref:hypothetical protein n=1 Tax=Amycolatopsis circi TaxID=871959 RepID=UPI001FC9315C|nr:hypothetical protein [Amycolatopsis circi]